MPQARKLPADHLLGLRETVLFDYYSTVPFLRQPFASKGLCATEQVDLHCVKWSLEKFVVDTTRSLFDNCPKKG